MIRRSLLPLALVVAGCYSPNPADKSWKCALEQGFLCPDGLVCDRKIGLCVKTITDDGGAGDMASPFDSSLPVGPRSCDERVKQGAFSNLTNLSSINTAGNESSISLSTDGKQLYYLDAAGALETAAVGADPKTVGAPQLVTLTGSPGAVSGAGSFGTDGTFWFAGNNGAGGPTSLYAAAKSTTTVFTATVHLPTATNCPFFDVALTDGSATKDLYVSAALAGCGNAPLVAQGLVDKQIGAFYGATTGGWRAPFVLPGGLTMVVASTPAAPARLSWTDRPGTDVQWLGTAPIPMDGLGGAGSGGDFQLIVAPGCHTAYLVSNRAGTKGGQDVWAADIAAQ